MWLPIYADHVSRQGVPFSPRPSELDGDVAATRVVRDRVSDESFPTNARGRDSVSAQPIILCQPIGPRIGMAIADSSEERLQ
jgi:hypothetical protein